MEELESDSTFDQISRELTDGNSARGFYEIAIDISKKENLPIEIVLAIGRGDLSSDKKASALFIQNYLNEGLTDEEISSRAACLAGLFGVSYQSIASMQRRRFSEERDHPVGSKQLAESVQAAVGAVLTEKDKRHIHDYVNGASNIEERRYRRQEMSRKYGVAVASIPGIIAWVTRRSKALCDLANEDIKGDLHLVPNGPCLAAIGRPQARFSDISEQALSENESSEGAHINYDNKIKNQWRRHLKKFVRNSIPRRDRAEKKVLCLPGKSWLEAREVYLKLGFTPENICGIERDRSVWAEFESQAAILGCQAHFGELSEFLRKSATRFDVVSIDLVGPLSGEFLSNTLPQLQLSDECVVMINSMGQRERLTTQELYQINNVGRGTITDFRIAVGQTLVKSHVAAEDVAQTRDDGARDIVYANLCNEVHPDYVDRLNVLINVLKGRKDLTTVDEDSKFKNIQSFLNLIEKIETLLFKELGELIPIVRLFVLTFLGRTLSIRKVESWEYKARKNKFLSDFFVLKRDRQLHASKEFAKLFEVIFFLVESAIHETHTGIKPQVGRQEIMKHSAPKMRRGLEKFARLTSHINRGTLEQDFQRHVIR